MRLEEGPLSVELMPFGAMLTGACVTLPNGRTVEPFFRNLWREEEGNLDRFTRNLSAEWPCVPFGLAGPVQGLPQEWQVPDEGDWNRVIHGFGSHNEWDLERVAANTLRARIAYPDSTPVAALEREVRLEPETLTIHLRLRIEAREDCRIATGLHPVFDLTGAAPGTCRLTVGGAETAWSYPMDVEPGASRFAPDQRGVPLSAMGAAKAGTIDGSRLPLDSDTEDLLLLTEPGGEVTLSRPDRGYTVSVLWDTRALPCCSLWYSNGGRHYSPWNGRVRAIGIEPTIAAFNLGQTHSLSDRTPLAKAGIPTAAPIGAGRAWETAYRIRVVPLG